MPLHPRHAAGALAFLALAAAPGAAQPTRSVATATEISLSVARNSPSVGILGKAEDMSLAIVALRITRPLFDSSRPGLFGNTARHVDLIPMVRISPSLISRDPADTPCPPKSVCVSEPTDHGDLFAANSVVGVGINPVGFTTYFRPRSRIAPSIGVTGGAIFFEERVPTTRGAKFNFTTAIELGLRLGRADRTSVVLSYRFHHISNAGTAPENVAVASHLFGAALRRGRPTPR